MSNTYDLGDKIRTKGTFTDENGAVHDPDKVYYKIMKPDGTVTAYEYGVDVELVRVSTGVYSVDIDIDAVYDWWYRFYSTGVGQAAGENTFRVRQTAFP